MSFAFLPWYTGDYLRDTRHLSPQKHGVYLLLLAHCWDQKGPLPLDEQECAGIANCRSQDEVDALRYILKRFFTRMDDGFYNKRMQNEIERAEAISRVRSDAGRKGFQAKAKHLPSKSQASASTPTPTPTTTPTPTESRKALSSPSDLDAAKRLLAFLNDKAGRAFKEVPSHLQMIRARLREHGEDSLRAMVAMKCREWRNDERMAEYLRPGTLFNATKCADYVGRVGTFEVNDEQR